MLNYRVKINKLGYNKQILESLGLANLQVNTSKWLRYNLSNQFVKKGFLNHNCNIMGINHIYYRERNTIKKTIIQYSYNGKIFQLVFKLSTKNSLPVVKPNLIINNRSG